MEKERMGIKSRAAAAFVSAVGAATLHAVRDVFGVFVVFCVGGLFSCASKGEKNVVAAEPFINGHEFVDLGLSVKWATCNVGASSPSDFGDYFAWGEISPKSEYTEDNSVTYGKKMGDISGDSLYDAARAHWGGSWRLPTGLEMLELRRRCTWRGMMLNLRSGYKITGFNGKSIFLPAAGYCYETMLNYAGKLGYYWSSTMSQDSTDGAYGLYFRSDTHDVDWADRYHGFPVRPVSE